MSVGAKSQQIAIEITGEEIEQSAVNLAYFLLEEAGYQDAEVDQVQLSRLVKQHLEEMIEEFLSNPEKVLAQSELEAAAACVAPPYEVVKKQLEQDIPLQ